MEYEKLYDKISEVCCDINDFYMQQWEKNGKVDSLVLVLQSAADNLKAVAHQLEEHLAWD